MLNDEPSSFSMFSLGLERTLQQYIKFSGIDPFRRVSDATRCGDNTWVHFNEALDMWRWLASSELNAPTRFQMATGERSENIRAAAAKAVELTSALHEEHSHGHLRKTGPIIARQDKLASMEALMLWPVWIDYVVYLFLLQGLFRSAFARRNTKHHSV